MRELIHNVVQDFYKNAMCDILIGYHFKKFQDPEVLKTHLIRLTSFWELQLTGATSEPLNEGFRLLYTHFELKLRRGELGRWIVLFHQTLDKLEQELDHPNIPLFVAEFKKRISIFEAKFLSAPNMFNQN